MKRFVLSMMAVTCGIVSAQPRFLDVQPRRTNDYDDNRGNGYCVVRLMVDDLVMVHIRGNRLRFETLQGRDARDDGSECSQAMPAGNALTNFRFKGVDGRGRVELAEQPSASNRYTAQVRILDSKGGDEGYTFRVQWDNRNPGQVSDNSGFGDRRQRGNDASGWGTSSSSTGSGWGSSNSSSSSGWGTGTASGTAWGQSDFEQTTTGTGVARMAGQSDLNLTSTRLRLRQGGQFVLEIMGAETVRFSGTWRRDGDTAILAINNGFANGGANGTGRAVVVNNQLQSLTLNGRSRATNATFQVEFRNSTAGRRFRR